jgi:hypothetical protein
VAALALAGCSSSFQPSSQAACASDQCKSSNPGGDGGTGGGGGGGGTGPAKTIYTGSINEGLFAGVQVVSLDLAKKELMLTLPMPLNGYIDGSKVDVMLKDIPGARLTLEQLPRGSSALVLRIPLTHVLKGVDFLPPSKLPNGDRLPQVPDGELPALAVQISQIKDIKATVYLGRTVVGIFINTPFDPYIGLTLPITNEDRSTTWGYFSTIPAKQGAADGGFFISFALPSDLARAIDDML